MKGAGRGRRDPFIHYHLSDKTRQMSDGPGNRLAGISLCSIMGDQSRSGGANERAEHDAEIGLDLPAAGDACSPASPRQATASRCQRRGSCSRRCCSSSCSGLGICGRPPCRSDCPCDRRALWHLAADAGGDHHRGRADCDNHAWRYRGARAGPRHGVRGGDDRLQRPGRHLHPDRRASVPRAGRPRCLAPTSISACCSCWRRSGW